MKRGGPLKRTGGLKRSPMKRKPPRPKVERIPLPADPVFSKTVGHSIKKPHLEGPLTPSEWWTAAMVRTGHREELNGTALTDLSAWAVQVHHVISKHWLRTNGYHEVVWHPDNSMVLKTSAHSDHETAARRIPRSKVREETWAFARSIGTPAVQYLEQHYPEGDS